MTYDFETIRAKLTGANVSDNARRHRLYPTDAQIQSTLDLHRQRGPLPTEHFAWQGDLWSVGLLEYAPLTPRQEKLKADGRGWALRRKFQITSEGEAFLWRLKLIKPHEVRATLRRYERRFSSATRWASAVIEAQRIAALNMLVAEHDAHGIDTRTLMGGAI